MLPNIAPIALELGARRIRAAQWLSEADGRVVWMDVPRERSDAVYTAEEFEAARRVMELRGFRGRRVVLSPPSDMLAFDWLPTPPAGSGAPIAKITGDEITRLHRYEAGSFEHIVCPSVDCGSGHRAATISCPHGPVNALLDAARGAGFNVVSVSPAVISLASRADAGGPVAALDLGWTSGRFLLLRRPNVVFVRVLPSLGIAQAVRDLAEKRGISEGAAEWALSSGRAEPLLARRLADVLKPFGELLAEEIAASVSYGCQILEMDLAEVTLTGGGAIDGEIDDLVLASTGLMAKRWGGLASRHPGLAGAIAMAEVAAGVGSDSAQPTDEKGAAA